MLTTPRWPQANGEVERQNRSIMKRLKIAQAQGVSVRRALREYLFTYRTTIHSTTGITPARLMFGRELRDKVPNIQQRTRPDVQVQDRDYEKKAKMKVYADTVRRASERELHPGETVLVRQEKGDKFSTNFSPRPHQVLSKCGSAVIMKTPEGKNMMRNSSFVIHKPQRPQGAESENPQSKIVEPSSPMKSEASSPQLQNAPTLEVRRSARERRCPVRYHDIMEI
jgi:hypothetical protein